MTKHRLPRALLLFFVLMPAYAAEPEKPSGYPSRPIEVIVPFARGGGLDASMRLLAKYGEVALGEQIEIVNMTRGGNIEGNLYAVNAEPDGYVLGCWGMGLVTDELVIKNCPYSHRDVEPVCIFGIDPHVIAVSAEFARRNGITSLDELFKYVRKHPGKVTFGSGGNWTSHDFTRLKMEHQAGVRFLRMPFLGGAPAASAAADGNCDVVTPFVPELLPYYGSGKVIPLAVTHTKRLPTLPDIPTTAEAGYPGLTQTMWRVITLPKNTPQELVRYLGWVFEKASASPEYRDEATKLGLHPVFKGPENLPEFLEKEFTHFEKSVREWGIRAVE